jgi:hypothetical protein
MGRPRDAGTPGALADPGRRTDMENFITGLVVAALMAPFVWPAFVVVYRYFRDVEDARFERTHEVKTGTPDRPVW